MGTLQRLPKVVGNESFVRDVCYTARRVHSQEAMSVGLVRYVPPPPPPPFTYTIDGFTLVLLLGCMYQLGVFQSFLTCLATCYIKISLLHASCRTNLVVKITTNPLWKLCPLYYTQGRIQANKAESPASVKKICFNYFLSASSKSIKKPRLHSSNSHTNLSHTNLSHTNLSHTNLSHTNLSQHH